MLQILFVIVASHVGLFELLFMVGSNTRHIVLWLVLGLYDVAEEETARGCGGPARREWF